MYELPPIHTLATTIQKNISNMNMQSSPGFDPLSASFIKHAEKTFKGDRGKRHTENVLLPLLSDLSSEQDGTPPVPVRRCHPTSLKQIQNLASAQERSNYIPPKVLICLLSMAVSIDFLQTWSGIVGLADELGSC